MIEDFLQNCPLNGALTHTHTHTQSLLHIPKNVYLSVLIAGYWVFIIILFIAIIVIIAVPYHKDKKNWSKPVLVSVGHSRKTQKCVRKKQYLKLDLSARFHKRFVKIWAAAQKKTTKWYALSEDSNQPVQSDQSLVCALWVAKDPNLHSKDCDQTWQMPRQIWGFTEWTGHLVGCVVLWLICSMLWMEK